MGLRERGREGRKERVGEGGREWERVGERVAVSGREWGREAGREWDRVGE